MFGESGSSTEAGPPERMMPRMLRSLQLLERDVAGMNLAVDMHFADPAGNQLGVLRTEIENQNQFVCLCGHSHLSSLRVNSRFQLMSSVSG